MIRLNYGIIKPFLFAFSFFTFIAGGLLSIAEADSRMFFISFCLFALYMIAEFKDADIFYKGVYSFTSKRLEKIETSISDLSKNILKEKEKPVETEKPNKKKA